MLNSFDVILFSRSSSRPDVVFVLASLSVEYNEQTSFNEATVYASREPTFTELTTG